MSTQQPVSLLLCALGGEGGGVLTEWLVDAARHAGYLAQATSIPGVAQRTGATTYYLEVFPVPLAELGGRRPVLGLYPMSGRMDALISSELLETVRQLGLGQASRERTLVISSTARALTTLEKMQMGDGRQDNATLAHIVAEHSRAHHLLDMGALTRQAGTVVSAVMLGAIAASGLLPMKRSDFEAVMGGNSASAKASLRGFALAYEAVERQRAQASYVEGLLAPAPASAPNPPALPNAFAQQFPASLHELLALGHARLLDYQDVAYARLYIERLRKVYETEQSRDPQAAHGLEVTRETARWLALWMAFDDIVRVADLKSRATRWSRVRQEVKADASDLVKLYDHFKPGLPEFAALLPQALAKPLLAWERRRLLAGKPALALPLKIGTHTVSGLLALRGLAALRWLRPKGSRYATEQALIEEWLDSLTSHLAQDWQAGLELARCGRLIKGYGSTNERGKDNLLHIIRHLDQAAAIAAAREAALTDEAGKKLDLTLQQHGAPARPLKEQPIRWMRRRPVERQQA